MGQKYVEGLPLYRQFQHWSSLRGELSRQTPADWVVIGSNTAPRSAQAGGVHRRCSTITRRLAVPQPPPPYRHEAAQKHAMMVPASPCVVPSIKRYRESFCGGRLKYRGSKGLFSRGTETGSIRDVIVLAIVEELDPAVAGLQC